MSENIEFIKVFEDTLSTDKCTEIITKYKRDGLKLAEENDYNLNSGVLEWHFSNLANWKECTDEISEMVNSYLDSYFSYSNLLNKESFYFSHMSLMHQLAERNVTYHYDSELEYMNGEEFIRNFAVLIYLNDDFSLGELVFPLQKKTIRPKPGRLVIFPTSFMYPHVTNPSIGGDRYALRLSYFFKKDVIINRNKGV